MTAMRAWVAKAKLDLAKAAIRTLEFQFKQWALDRLYMYVFPRPGPDERHPAPRERFTYLDIAGDDRHAR